MRAQVWSTSAPGISVPSARRMARSARRIATGMPSIGAPLVTATPSAVSLAKCRPTEASGTPLPVSSGAVRMFTSGAFGAARWATASAASSQSVPEAASTIAVPAGSP